MDRGLVRRDWNAIITKRIKRDGRADELRRCGIKDWIGLVQDAVESRGGHLRPRLHVLNLTIAESSVIPPAAIKQFVSLDAEGAQPRVSFIFEYTVTEFSQTRPRAAGDNLVEGIKRIECAFWDTSFRVRGGVGWFRA